MGGRDGHSWFGRRGLLVPVGMVVGAASTVALVYAVGPFASVEVSLWVGVGLSGLVHAALAGLLVLLGWRFATAPRWWRPLVAAGCFLVAGLVAVLVAVADGWIAGALVGNQQWAFVVVTVAAVPVGAGVEHVRVRRWGGRPERSASRRVRGVNNVALSGLGVGLGVLTVVAMFAAGAQWRAVHQERPTEADIRPVEGLAGVYWALGDSYSAGARINPIEAGSGGGGDGCGRSTRAYPRLLPVPAAMPVEFRACSGAVIADVYAAHPENDSGRVAVPPQVDGRRHDEVALVTMTIGGNDMGFSAIVTECAAHVDCMTRPFRGRARLDAWIEATLPNVAKHQRKLFRRLAEDVPSARVIVIGYPYLFPAGPAGLTLSHCASVLRRVDEGERAAIRRFTDEFNEATHAEALGAGIEYVSPMATWAGHEPCGAEGQYTNTVLFPFGGSFHPNRTGHRALAQLVSCYLGSHPSPPGRGATAAGEPPVAPGDPGNEIECPQAP